MKNIETIYSRSALDSVLNKITYYQKLERESGEPLGTYPREHLKLLYKMRVELRDTMKKLGQL